MPMPIDLVIVRHGQSEGNAAKRMYEQGNSGVYTKEFLARHSSSYRLTDLGRRQAKIAGRWIRKNFKLGFDRYYVSEYLRAMETAAHLGIPGATWFADYYLTERDWGELDFYPEEERLEKFGDVLSHRNADPFFWRPPNGESFAQLCLRVDRVLNTLHRECSDKRAIIVCHGEVIVAFRTRIERLTQERFREVVSSDKSSQDHIYNCQIIHYSRRENGVGELSPYINWMRMIRPTSKPVWDTGWMEIQRNKYSNEDLLELVSNTVPMIR